MEETVHQIYVHHYNGWSHCAARNRHCMHWAIHNDLGKSIILLIRSVVAKHPVVHASGDEIVSTLKLCAKLECSSTYGQPWCCRRQAAIR